MKSVVYLSCIIWGSVISACVQQPKKSFQVSEKNVISIDFNHAESLQASVLFDTIEYIPLETNDSFLVSGINHLKMGRNEDFYFISDKSFFLFDGQTGKGKLRIARLGSGPNEYTSIFDSYLDINTGQIELLDNNGKKVVIYDSDGNYLRSIPLPFMPFMLVKTEPSSYWFYNNNLMSDATDSKVVHYDAEKERIIGEYFPIDQHLAEYFFMEDEKNLVAHDNTLFYMSSPADTIYRIIPGTGAEAAYVLDLGDHNAPKDFFTANYRDIMEFVETARKHDYVFEMPTLAVNDNWVVVACIKKGELFLTFHSVEEGKSITFSSLHDDFHFDTSLPLKSRNMHFCMNADSFYFTMTAEQLVDWQKKSGRQDDKVQKLIESQTITDYSNPILVKCRLKTN